MPEKQSVPEQAQKAHAKAGTVQQAAPIFTLISGSQIARLVEQARSMPGTLSAAHVLRLQRAVGNRAVNHLLQSATPPVIQRRKLPLGRHREIVVDAAGRLADPVAASNSRWILAIFEELEGEGHPGAGKVVEKLIEQSILDQEDWNLIEKDYKLYKEVAGEGFELYERHNVPQAHNEAEANKWVATLIKNRIEDLYSTLEGFKGHADQVQLGITSLVGWYEENRFSEEAYEKYKAQILKALRQGKAESEFDIPKYAYKFENGSVEAV